MVGLKRPKKKWKILNAKKRWENIYQTKELKDVSWFQQTPETSLDFITQFNVPTTSKDIEISGGDSFLVDQLLMIKRFGTTRMARRAAPYSTTQKAGKPRPSPCPKTCAETLPIPDRH